MIWGDVICGTFIVGIGVWGYSILYDVTAVVSHDLRFEGWGTTPDSEVARHLSSPREVMI